MFKQNIKNKPARLYYPGDDLGLTFSESEITYKIWSPPAQSAAIEIYADDQGTKKLEEFELQSAPSDTWKVKLPQKYYGNYYRLHLQLPRQEYNFVDPWTKAVGTNSEYGLIVDPSRIYPPTWTKDQRVVLEDPVDAVIYELHVKDFSISKESGIRHRGKYTAFTERHSVNKEGMLTGIAHLKELGVTHVHLLPVYDFATVDDTDPDDYNWGYDPLYYMVPEGSYASNPANESRIYEFKKMVKTLHSYGIGVIMDVVYNHTYHTQESPFQKIFPNYFYRFTEDSSFANASGCGNEIASEREMMRKYIVDSLLYWSREYHIDGFRFDLMSSIDRETMLLAENKLREENPSVLIYGEPWTALEPQLESYQQIRKGDQRGTGISVFNDNFRNALKGDSDGTGKGFIQGKIGLEREIDEGVIGAIGLEERRLYGFALQPGESINYLASHDNLTLWDKLARSCPGANEQQRKKMHKLAQVILFTSQGVPFIPAGTEFLRTKFGDNNSFDSGIEVNELKWERKTTYREHFNYLKGLINLRSHHPAFRMRNRSAIKENLHFIASPFGTVGYGIFNNANEDAWSKIIVLLNPSQEWKQFYLPESRTWAIVVDDQGAGTEPIRFFHSNEVMVPPISGMVIYAADLVTGY
ncbi:pullulanase [Halanaerobium saccharolyticum]|uniref:Pullulanase n=1 Tax=Halanaerobium saccharolyticum TaxID=43595 RepID=A0A4R7Z685_9FIRM|nr:type I pullulanase [Halanaerobium saccharolyticum]RAK08461.1 pullulanase [Halanaerobium saccharolyticum]TDW03504.1 pullulanase [Halanaerobium saccharolyticum]TDX59953.1 pullulanase [Halanaerobium saccharolyticum]